MTEKAENFLLKSTMTYGLYMGLAMSLVIFMFHLAGNTHVPGDNTGLINTMVMAFAMMIFGRKFQREFYPEGIKYKDALGFTLLLSLFGSAILSIFSYWYFKFIAPDAILIFIQQAEVTLLEVTSLTNEQRELMLQMYNDYMSPMAMGMGAGFNRLFSGLVFSFVVSYFIKSPLHLGHNKR